MVAPITSVPGKFDSRHTHIQNIYIYTYVCMSYYAYYGYVYICMYVDQGNNIYASFCLRVCVERECMCSVHAPNTDIYVSSPMSSGLCCPGGSAKNNSLN